MSKLKANCITCERGERKLFQNLSFTLQSGEVLHIKGQNGSGKTSLLRILSGLATANAGDILWNETNILQNRSDFCQNLLFLGHELGLTRGLSVRENLQYLLAVLGIKKQMTIVQALELMGLTRFIKEPVESLSQGQRRRVLQSLLYLKHAKLWILDEPFATLDNTACECLSRCILDFNAKNGIVIISSHQKIALNTANIKTIDLDHA